MGPIPDLSHFDPDGFSPKGKAALQTWHAEQVRREVVYDFAKELEEYCQSDVDILQRRCEAFCQEFESHAGFNPFAKCVTIASACNLYWRKFHLPVDTIAVQPPSGWRGANVNHSLQALQWLYYQESLLPKEGAAADRIRHVRNGGEVSLRLDGDMTFVDGYDATTRTVYEFHGCLWHGCPTCCQTLRQSKYAAHADRTLAELYAATQHKTQRLRQVGYRVIEMWGCQWERQLKQDQATRDFVTHLPLVPPLERREAFFGGRTGAVALHSVADTEWGEQILYNDVTSLYPWVNKTQLYPVGHPKSSRNRSIRLCRTILVLPLWTFYLLLNSFIPCYLSGVEENSPFLFVLLAFTKSRLNPCWNEVPSVIIPFPASTARHVVYSGARKSRRKGVQVGAPPRGFSFSSRTTSSWVIPRVRGRLVKD